MVSLGDKCLFGLFVSVVLCECVANRVSGEDYFHEFEDVVSRARKTSRGGQECAT